MVSCGEVVGAYREVLQKYWYMVLDQASEEGSSIP